MLAKQEAAVRGLRAIKSAIIVEKTSGAGGVISAEAEMKMLQKLVKQRKESADIYVQQNRADLAKTEQEEIAVIEKYLPKQMDENELRVELKKIIENVGAKTLADLGKVMGVASKQFAGKADGKMISQIVKELLSAGA